MGSPLFCVWKICCLAHPVPLPRVAVRLLCTMPPAK